MKKKPVNKQEEKKRGRGGRGQKESDWWEQGPNAQSPSRVSTHGQESPGPESNLQPVVSDLKCLLENKRETAGAAAQGSAG